LGAAKPSWKLRRRAVFGSMMFGVLTVIYVAIRWDDTALAQTLALSGFGLIGAVVAAYIGGAAYEDVRLRPDHQLFYNMTNSSGDDYSLEADEYQEGK
jgi:hypothetical protein